MTILCTLLYSAVAIAAVNYSHPPSQESAWCGALGFLLHYSFYFVQFTTLTQNAASLIQEVSNVVLVI